MQVILAEKPDQARKYAAPFKSRKQKSYIELEPCSTFPAGAVVVWAIGHLCEIAPPEVYDDKWGKWQLDTLPMIPETFKHQVVKDKRRHFKTVKEQLQKADEIVIATDPAREGELIARLIIQLAGANNKSLKRLWCSSLTPAAIKKAFGELKDGRQTYSLYQEALARSYSDWLVGMNTSRVYTLLMQQKGAQGVFSTGRVQTPVLCLIQQRDQEIVNFKAETYWEVVGLFQTNDHQTFEGKLKINGKSRFRDKSKAEQILNEVNQQMGEIVDIKIEKKVKKPPLLHNLSSLQSKLNSKYKLSPSKVLETVQNLYEKGHVSYPRSEFQHLPIAEAKALPAVMQSLQKLTRYATMIHGTQTTDLRGNKRYVDDEKVGDHYAIIPTNQPPHVDNLSRNEINVYDEIVKSLVAAHYPDHTYNQITVRTDVKNHAFFSTGKQIVENGWKVVWGNQPEKEKKDDEQKLPASLQQGQSVRSSSELKEGVTKPPKLYTEGQLITLMKTAGKTIDNEALSKEMSLSKMGLGTEATRSGMIQTLINRQYIEVNKNNVTTTPKGQMLVKAVGNTVLGNAEMTAKWELFLSKIGEGEKKAATFIEQSKRLTEKLVSDAQRYAESWDFSSYVQQTEQDKYLGNCPKCGAGVVDRKKFFGCSAYKEKGCNFTLPGKLSGKRISKTNVKKLLTSGKTNLIKGFKSKNNKTFDAYIVWKDAAAGKFKFEFNNSNKKANRKSLF